MFVPYFLPNSLLRLYQIFKELISNLNLMVLTAVKTTVCVVTPRSIDVVINVLEENIVSICRIEKMQLLH
jgi:hypothetical protein